MQLAILPTPDEMYRAVERRDASFEGIFFTAVRTTGIFCRPGCPARTPARENVEFYATAREAIFAGYRPCRRCRPLEPAGAVPEWLRPLLEEIEADPQARIRDAELRSQERHHDRLSAGRLETIQTTSLHTDVIRDLKRINSHLTSVAYPILEAAGELASSRLIEGEGRHVPGMPPAASPRAG